MREPVRVYVDLIGDLFHPGHVRLLERARALGDRLVVGVLGDTDAERLSHLPVMSLDERVAVVRACRFADEVIAGAPAAPGMDFVRALQVAKVCLVDDFGDAARADAQRAIDASGLGVRVAHEAAITTADVVARLLGAESAPTGLASPRRSPAGDDPPGDAGHDEVTAAIAALSTLAEGQRALADSIGALAAMALGRPWLRLDAQSSPSNWAQVLRAAAAEEHARLDAAFEAPPDLSALAALVEGAASPDEAVVLLGGQAIGLGLALAGARPGEVCALLPDLSAGLEATPGEARLANARELRLHACQWREIGWVFPDADLLAVLDRHTGARVLRDQPLLLRLSRRLRGGVLIPVPISPEAKRATGPALDLDGFVFSDVFVRGMLHGAAFYEVVDRATIVNGIPVPAEQGGRVSRFCVREAQSHGPRFRYLDGRPAAALQAPAGARIVRWYLARKQPFELGPDGDEG